MECSYLLHHDQHSEAWVRSLTLLGCCICMSKQTQIDKWRYTECMHHHTDIVSRLWSYGWCKISVKFKFKPKFTPGKVCKIEYFRWPWRATQNTSMGCRLECTVLSKLEYEFSHSTVQKLMHIALGWKPCWLHHSHSERIVCCMSDAGGLRVNCWRARGSFPWLRRCESSDDPLWQVYWTSKRVSSFCFCHHLYTQSRFKLHLPIFSQLPLLTIIVC